jgi:hypothetical protein
MRSGYALRTDLLRTSLPYWVKLATGRTAPLTFAEFGPVVGVLNPIGSFIEDYYYRGDVAGRGTWGIDWDLDRYNCRRCKTPEFPNGTYAYFVTLESDLKTPAFPYILGGQYFGVLRGEMGAGAGAPTIPADASTYTGPFTFGLSDGP